MHGSHCVGRETNRLEESYGICIVYRWKDHPTLIVWTRLRCMSFQSCVVFQAVTGIRFRQTAFRISWWHDTHTDNIVIITWHTYCQHCHKDTTHILPTLSQWHDTLTDNIVTITWHTYWQHCHNNMTHILPTLSQWHDTHTDNIVTMTRHTYWQHCHNNMTHIYCQHCHNDTTPILTTFNNIWN